MDVVVFAVILIALAAFVAAPLYGRGSLQPTEDPSVSNARRDALLAALRELEVDKASGLLDSAEYETERSALESQATPPTAEPGPGTGVC